ncbi:hypothetical protein BDGGKGIB_03251 [Nodularia sphaerocarpa UHCC 0038]|nr:hypothetical protein BDGGKGIB_03251 [Nodularia sphaerocarpa UHCC 0038]
MYKNYGKFKIVNVVMIVVITHTNESQAILALT